MKKFLIYIGLIIFVILIIWPELSFAWNLWEGANLWWSSRNSILNNFISGFTTFNSYSSWWITNVIIQIAKDLKNIFFVLATIYFIAIVIKLLISVILKKKFLNLKNELFG